VTADVALSICVFNAGFAISAMPTWIFPATSGEMKGHLNANIPYPLSPKSLAAQMPGTFTVAAMHHVKLQDVKRVAMLEDAMLKKISPKLAQRAFWDFVNEVCRCGKVDSEFLSRTKRGCVASNCVPLANNSNSVTSFVLTCCYCRQDQWRAVYSPRCEV
jgi:hypothetical protein